MSSRSLRRVLVGSLVMAFLSLGPVSGEATDFLEMPEVSSLWVRACEWVMAQISPVEEASAAAPPAEASADRDAGWMLDPNG